MNTKTKMHRIHSKGLKLGDSLGYFVHTHPHLRFGTKSNYPDALHSKDIYGLWDALYVGKQGQGVLFVQYSSNGYHTLKQYEDWVFKTMQPVLLLSWYNRKGFKAKLIHLKKLNMELTYVEMALTGAGIETRTLLLEV